MKRILFAVCTLFIFITSFSISAMASSVNHYYSNLPEPQVYNAVDEIELSIKWILADRDDGLVLFKVSYSPFLSTYIEYVSNNYSLHATNLTSAQGTLILSRYDARTGAYQATYSYTINGQNQRTVGIGNPYSMILYGFTYYNTNGVKLTNISWSDTNNPATYENWLQDIYTRQGNIQQDLELFYNAFNTFKQVNHSDLTNIYTVLNNIYNLLNNQNQSSTYDTDTKDEIEEYQSLENSFNRDISGDLDSAFSSSGTVFTSNNGFSLLSNGLTQFILSNSKLVALIMFSLSLGLGVLIIGRKINA